METNNVGAPVDVSTTPMEANNAEVPADLSTTSMEPNNADTPVDLSATSMEPNNAEVPVDLTTTSMGPENVDAPVDVSTTPMGPENVDAPVDLSGTLDEPVITPNLEDTSNDLTNNMDLDAKVDLSNDEALASANAESGSLDEDQLISTKTPEITEPVVDESVSNIEPTVDESVSNVEANNETKEETPLPNKKELMNSLSNVVDYITDAVAEKVSLNVTSAQFGEKQQNGFDSVNAAAEMMAKTGGKRRKTRKFKLTNKNKTKRAKKV
jgi:hypothetical protein